MEFLNYVCPSIILICGIVSIFFAEIKIKDTHVLVTDDNHINLKVIINTLEYYGLKVDTAASGVEAISLCEANIYDLVFMDQMMPHRDGIETMHRIRQLSSHYAAGSACKIIVLTTNTILGIRDELLKKGFDEYLSKPIQFRDLEHILRLFISTDKFVHFVHNEVPSDTQPGNPPAKKPSSTTNAPHMQNTAPTL